MRKPSPPSVPRPKTLASVATNMPKESDIDQVLAESGLPRFTPLIRSQFALYLNLLMKWNKAMNLVGARDWRTALLNLMADSFYLDNFMGSLGLPANPEIWDLGSGAGLPGIPLRIIRQTGVYRMIEAREKRALFIANALAALKLPDTFVHQARVENFFQNPPGARQAQIIISRAFKPWLEVLELTRPHLARQGLTLIMSNGQEEKAAPTGWKSAGIMAYDLTGSPRIFQAFEAVEP